MRVDEQHDPIGEHLRQLREARITIGGGHVGRRMTARKRLEPEQEPHWIVRDIEDKRSIRRKGQDDAGFFGFVGGEGRAEEQQRGQKPNHWRIIRRV